MRKILPCLLITTLLSVSAHPSYSGHANHANNQVLRSAVKPLFKRISPKRVAKNYISLIKENPKRAAASALLGVPAFMALSGVITGAIAKFGLPDNSEARKHLIAAGAAKGAIEGALMVPNLLSLGLLNAPIQVASGQAAAKIMGNKDLDRVAKASAASGAISTGYGALMNVPILNMLNVANVAKGAATASVLGTDVPKAAAYGILGSGELVALAQATDKSNKIK